MKTLSYDFENVRDPGAFISSHQKGCQCTLCVAVSADQHLADDRIVLLVKRAIREMVREMGLDI